MSSMPFTNTSNSGKLDDDEDLPNSILTKFVGRFKFLWELRCKGDCHLHVACSQQSSNQPKPRKQDNGNVLVVGAEESPCANATIMCHTTMLSAGSEYFMKRLQSSGSRGITSDGSSSEQQLKYVDDRKDGITYLEEQLNDNDELPAFEAMIQFFYLAKIDSALSVPELLTLLEVADRFAAMECRAATIHMLLKKLKTTANNDDITMICNFEPTNMDGWHAVEEMLQKALLTMFGVAWKTIEDPTLCSLWEKLPWKIVRFVLTSDELELDSEEAVAYLAQIWIHAQTDLTREIAVDIETSIIRFGLLCTPFFGGYLIKNAKWLTVVTNFQHQFYRSKCAPKRAYKTLLDYLPHDWDAKRPRGYTPREFACSLEVSETDFRAALKECHGNAGADKTFESEPCYVKGWFLSLQVVVWWDTVDVALEVKSATGWKNTFASGIKMWLCGQPFPCDKFNTFNVDIISDISELMSFEVAGTPHMWPAGKYFKNGKMHIRFEVDSLY